MKNIESIVILALLASPALADVYKCSSGNKTIYQDSPCPNAKLIGNANSLPLSQQQQIQAKERVEKERALLDKFSKAHEADTPNTDAQSTGTGGPRPVSSKSSGSDRYRGSPARNNDRSDKPNQPSSNSGPSMSNDGPDSGG